MFDCAFRINYQLFCEWFYVVLNKMLPLVIYIFFADNFVFAFFAFLSIRSHLFFEKAAQSRKEVELKSQWYIWDILQGVSAPGV